MSGLAQFQVRPESTYIFGRAASQGGRFTGGNYQMYINNLGNLIQTVLKSFSLKFMSIPCLFMKFGKPSFSMVSVRCTFV